MTQLRWKRIVGIGAISFGVVTLLSGGSVLFGPEAVQQAAGNTVEFVLWFNFLSGALYVLAGVGIALNKIWAGFMSVLLALFLTVILLFFGWHIYAGGAFEMRTVSAMLFRTVFWVTVAIALTRSARQQE